MLQIEGLSIHYGVIPAVKKLNIEVKQGEVVTLIGANGSGKTTTLRGISGITRAKEGKILFQGKDITKMEAHQIVAMGISQVPEGRGVFPDLKVIENLYMGAYLRRDKKQIQRDVEEVFHLFPRLEERKEQVAGTLSGGEQQMLAMGRALMSKPKLLLLDEPSMGLAPIIVKEIFKIVKRINEEGTTVLLVEQNANMALSVAHRGYVLETGEIVEQGTVTELQNNDKIRKIYLGIH
ncbi:ABC transporter ATP-binding protein [Brevibacillus massiliensis]|jgi:branched-chain amino acid transport system ATP-binding protein|uniref:ABC transporter ATP-binding protein n=1 Tax=Brevibacillus massiliensis TaxID=1118054 RepID=UPI00031D4305|nr:ABC transporter ATP-binding protein [Brevibacillus massiliensis]